MSRNSVLNNKIKRNTLWYYSTNRQIDDNSTAVLLNVAFQSVSCHGVRGNRGVPSVKGIFFEGRGVIIIVKIIVLLAKKMKQKVKY